jgi:ubiquitin C-terminal hydrolase
MCFDVDVLSTEKYQLQFCKVLMTSRYLNLRIRGLAILNDLLAEIQKKETNKKSGINYYTYSYSRQATPDPTVQWLTSQWTCKWIIENAIIELILGDESVLKRCGLQDTHDELLKRSLQTLVFVSNRGQLQEDHIMLLWHAGGQKNSPTASTATLSAQSSTTTRTVYKVLSQLSVKLSPEHLSLLVGLIKTIALPVDEGKIELIRGIAEGVLSSGGSVDDNFVGVSLLWNVILSRDPPSPSTALASTDLKLSRTQEAAVNALASLVSKPQLRGSFKAHLGRCVDVIRGGPLAASEDVASRAPSSRETAMDVVCCLELLKKIVELQPEASRGLSAKLMLTRDKIIKDCEDEFKLMRALMLCIGRSLSADRRAPGMVTQETAAEDVVEDDDANTVNLDDEDEPDNFSTVINDTRDANVPPAVLLESIRGDSNTASNRPLLHKCMAFLEFILSNSGLEIDYHTLRLLWGQYASHGSIADMESGFFSWVQKSCTDNTAASTSAYTSYYSSNRSVSLHRKCLTDDAVERMLTELFGARDPPDGFDMRLLGEEGFAALEKVFRHINGQAKTINYAHNKTNFVVRVMPTELIGLTIVMRAYMQTENVHVAHAAANFLTLLQIKLDATLDRKKAYPLFTNFCIDHVHRLATEAASLPDESRARRERIDMGISRVLSLLRQFFLDICSPGAVSIPVSTSVYYKPTTAGVKSGSWHLTVYWRREGVSMPANQKIVYIFKRGLVTVGALRSRIAKDFKVSPQVLRLINSGRAVMLSKNDDQLAENSGVSSFLDAVILRVPLDDTTGAALCSPATTLAEDPDSDQMYPRKLLSNKKNHLSLIFELLSHRSGEISQSAWGLLDLLPVNADMLVEMKTLGGAGESNVAVQWESLLSEGGILRQQYRLKIIAELLAPLQNEYAAKGDLTEAKRWKSEFIRLGGASYLLQLVMEMRIGQQDEDLAWGPKLQCLSSILELLDQFISANSSDASQSQESAGQEGGDVDIMRSLFNNYSYETVVQKLMDALFVMSTESCDSCEGGEIASISRMRSNSTTDDHMPGLDPALVKQRKKRSRAARFEQYFSSATKNTSTAVSLPDSRSAAFDSDDAGGCANAVNHSAASAKYGLSVLAAVTARFPDAVRVVKSYSNLQQCLHSALLETADDGFRDTFCKGILHLCHTSVSSGDISLCTEVTTSLLSFLGGVTTKGAAERDDLKVHTSEYFYALSELCREISTCPNQILSDSEIVKLGNDLSDFVLTYRKCELSEEEEEEDKLLQGMLLLFASFLELKCQSEVLQSSLKLTLGSSKGVVVCLFNDYLFSVDSGKSKATIDSFPRCKTAASRHRAFAALAELCKGCPGNLKVIIELIKPHHSIAAEPIKADSALTPSKSLKRHGRDVLVPKSRTGYCGLQNPGCICYMNSTLQQLFMVPAFRYGILGADTDVSSPSDAEAKDDILFQLQLLFAYLQESNKAYVDPTGFSAAFKDYEGQPTDVLVQQDASEFLSNFFQQIEGVLMGSKLETLLKDTYGGVFSNELLADGGKRSERAEPFFMISVGVGQGKNSLESALESFIAGETVDYTWETEVDGPNGKEIKKESLSTVKRTSIRSLPNHLIVHLKRFEFDFETMQQIKINEKFTFPLNLDMFPYTVNGRKQAEQHEAEEGEGEASARDAAHQEDSKGENEKDENNESDEDGYEYELSGVVVHVGTAHSGHYYSYIKERGSEGDRRGGASFQRSKDNALPVSASWFEFNDSFVSEFDIDDLEEETFGGVETWSGGAAAGGGTTGATAGKQFEKARNAFMLVYDRKKKVAKGEVSDSGATELYPPTLVTEAIMQDNDSFWRTKSIFNAAYYKFLANLFLNPSYEVGIDREMDRMTMDCAVRVTFGTLTQARERDRVSKWCTWMMNNMIRRSPQCGYDLLEQITSPEKSTSDDSDNVLVRLQLKSLLLDVEDAEVRSSLMRVILVAMEVVIHSPTVKTDSGSDRDGASLCLDFVCHIMGLVRVAQIKWHNISVFFSPVAHLAQHSPEMKAEMRTRNYLAILLSLFLASDTPYPELVGGSEAANHKSRSMTDGYTVPDYRSLLRSIATLLFEDEDAPSPQQLGRGSDAEEGVGVSTAAASSSAGAAAEPEMCQEKGELIEWLSEEAVAMLDLPVFSYR